MKGESLLGNCKSLVVYEACAVLRLYYLVASSWGVGVCSCCLCFSSGKSLCL